MHLYYCTAVDIRLIPVVNTYFMGITNYWVRLTAEIFWERLSDNLSLNIIPIPI